MLGSRRFVLLLLPALFLLMAFRQTPLVNPPAIAVTGKISSSQVLKAIRMAFVHRGWTITNVKPGEVDSTLSVRDHVAKVAINYSSTLVRINHVDSTNLKYQKKNGTAYIHKNYLGWVENLSRDIQSNLLLLGG